VSHSRDAPGCVCVLWRTRGAEGINVNMCFRRWGIPLGGSPVWSRITYVVFYFIDELTKGLCLDFRVVTFNPAVRDDLAFGCSPL